MLNGTTIAQDCEAIKQKLKGDITEEQAMQLMDAFFDKWERSKDFLQHYEALEPHSNKCFENFHTTFSF